MRFDCRVVDQTQVVGEGLEIRVQTVTLQPLHSFHQRGFTVIGYGGQ